MPNGAVPSLADGLDRKLLVGRFQFLEAHDVVVGGRQPFEEHRQPTVDAVHIEGGDANHPPVWPDLFLAQLVLDLLATVADRFHRRLHVGLAGPGLARLVFHLMILPASDLRAVLAAPRVV